MSLNPFNHDGYCSYCGEKEPCSCFDEVCATIKQSIYILVALEDERVMECIAIGDLETANRIEHALRKAYGGANVAMCSRQIDDIPLLIQERIMIDSVVEGVNQRIAKQKQGTPTTRDR